MQVKQIASQKSSHSPGNGDILKISRWMENKGRSLKIPQSPVTHIAAARLLRAQSAKQNQNRSEGNNNI